MGKRHGWIAVALVTFVGGTALAQQTYQDDAPIRDQTGAPPQPAQQPATEPSTEGAADDASKPQPSPRTSQIQSDGVRLSQLDSQQITELQQALQDAGYYMAEVDGIVGPHTKRALRQFYSDQAQLASQGMILPQGAAALGLDQAEIERVRGEEPVQTEEEPARPTPGAGAADDTTDTTQEPQRSPSSPTPSPGAPNPAPPGHGTNGTGPMP